MDEHMEYVAILLANLSLIDQVQLEYHLSANGYHFGFDTRRNLLFVFVEEVDYVITILEDRGIKYAIQTY